MCVSACIGDCHADMALLDTVIGMETPKIIV